MSVLTRPTLSLIIPMFNEQESVALFFEQAVSVLSSLEISYEMICIDDGSTDHTFALVLEHRKKNPQIKAIRFTRNFGKEAALSAGLALCSGACAIPIDVDLQNPVALIPEMLAEWRAGALNVLAVKKAQPYESRLKRVTSRWFYKLFNFLSENNIQPNTSDFRLIDRKIIDAVVRLSERNRFMKGILAWPGGQTALVYYTPAKRIAGKTKWNYLKLWNFAIDGITAFSSMPLKIWSYIGVFIACGAFVYALQVILKFFITGESVKGYPSLMVAILFLGGIQLISIGVLGEYVARIFKESKQRPLYLIQETYGFDSEV